MCFQQDDANRALKHATSIDRIVYAAASNVMCAAIFIRDPTVQDHPCNLRHKNWRTQRPAWLNYRCESNITARSKLNVKGPIMILDRSTVSIKNHACHVETKWSVLVWDPSNSFSFKKNNEDHLHTRTSIHFYEYIHATLSL